MSALFAFTAVRESTLIAQQCSRSRDFIIISSERESDKHHQREDRLRKKRDDKVRQKSKKGPSSMIKCPFSVHGALSPWPLGNIMRQEFGFGRRPQMNEPACSYVSAPTCHFNRGSHHGSPLASTLHLNHANVTPHVQISFRSPRTCKWGCFMWIHE